MSVYEQTDSGANNNYRTIESVTHGKHIASALQRLTGLCCLGQISAFIDENHRKHINTGGGKNTVLKYY